MTQFVEEDLIRIVSRLTEGEVRHVLNQLCLSNPGIVQSVLENSFKVLQQPPPTQIQDDEHSAATAATQRHSNLSPLAPVEDADEDDIVPPLRPGFKREASSGDLQLPPSSAAEAPKSRPPIRGDPSMGDLQPMLTSKSAGGQPMRN